MARASTIVPTAQILLLIQQHPQQLTARDVAERLHLQEQACQHIIKTLVNARILERVTGKTLQVVHAG